MDSDMEFSDECILAVHTLIRISKDELVDIRNLIHFQKTTEVISKKRKTSDPDFTELYEWLTVNLSNPYPSENQINIFLQTTDLTETQIRNWFSNARRRWPQLKGKCRRIKKQNRQ